ncbi:ArgR family transcriptional regulator [Lentilactobacillus sp. Marseille-Q4993]|uniref:arginine repressor n=1 Tax=Lentilactobacillus sp. Marseille-Q4993 TaxID=3039492 RepID=UPI0024BC10F4|nr:ArgR family transcriptional regulator [Lentilactobacillus sp. Marseille-Q4993]
MRKKERQRLIRMLIETNDLERQEDFVEALNKQNVWVTQATVSRDIKEMQLVKVPSTSGGYRYSMPSQKNVDTQKKLVQSVHDSFVSISQMDKFIFMKVLPGSGPVISNLIDEMKYDDIFGTLGDDNTVFILCRGEEEAQKFQTTIDGMVKNS